MADSLDRDAIDFASLSDEKGLFTSFHDETEESTGTEVEKELEFVLPLPGQFEF